MSNTTVWFIFTGICGVLLGVLLAIAIREWREVRWFQKIAKRDFGISLSYNRTCEYLIKSEHQGYIWFRNKCADYKIRTIPTNEERWVYINKRLSEEEHSRELLDWEDRVRKDFGFSYIQKRSTD